jgi:hypothetical protein
VIFDLPPQFGYSPGPLAYVEWYTGFNRPDPILGMYRVKPAYARVRDLRRRAEVIPLHHILRSCHLEADCGKTLGKRWTSDTALDLAPSFLFNHYFSIDMFAFVLFPSVRPCVASASTHESDVD